MVWFWNLGRDDYRPNGDFSYQYMTEEEVNEKLQQCLCSLHDMDYRIYCEECQERYGDLLKIIAGTKK